MNETNWIVVRKKEDAKDLFNEDKKNKEESAVLQNTSLDDTGIETQSVERSDYIQQATAGKEGLPEGSILVFTLDAPWRRPC